MQRKTQKTTFFKIVLQREHASAQVKKWLGQHFAVRHHDFDQAILLNHQHTAAAVGQLFQVDRGCQVLGQQLQLQLRCLRLCIRAKESRQSED